MYEGTGKMVCCGEADGEGVEVIESASTEGEEPAVSRCRYRAAANFSRMVVSA